MAVGDRWEVVDALRAIALLGIVVVNVAGYRRGVGPTLAAGAGDPGGEVTPLTVAVASIAEGRFYPLFSFLFGWGFAVQDARATARGSSVVGPWLRRCAALLVLGVAHAVLLFDGDILMTYAVLGAGLVAVRKVPVGWLAALGAAFVVLQAVFTSGLVGLGAAFVGTEGAMSLDELRADTFSGWVDDAAVYASGSFGDVVRLRSGDLFVDLLFGFLTVGGTVLGMMLLGVAAGRGRWVDVSTWPAWLRLSLVPMWVAGIVVSVPLTWLNADLVAGTDDPVRAVVGWMGYALLGPAVALGWAGVVVLLGRRPGATRALRWLGPMGRMSLTAYLSQSLVASFVFNGYGLGLGDRVGIGGALVLAVAFWAVQVALAQLWSLRFTMGPLEALTRAVAYLRWPRVRRSSLAAAPGDG